MSVFTVYICVYICFCICTWTGVWGYITVQAGRPREGIWRIGWFAGVERTREPLLYCTVLAAVPGRRPRRAHIHLGPDNSLRIGLLPDASSHIPWTFGFLGFHWRHQGHCGVTSGHLEWTDWFNWSVSHKFHYFQLGLTWWAAIIILAGRCQKTEWEVNQWQLKLFLVEVLAIRLS